MEGLKSNLKDRVEKRETKVVQQVSSEELSLFARLDELEEKEAENAELDQLWENDAGYKENKTGYTQKEDDKRWTPTESENTNQAKRKITWETLDNKNDIVVNSSDSSESDNDNGDEDIQRTISVRFSSSSTVLKGQVNNSLLVVCIYMICIFNHGDLCLVSVSMVGNPMSGFNEKTKQTKNLTNNPKQNTKSATYEFYKQLTYVWNDSHYQYTI